MTSLKNLSSFVIGLALFSMFFGSGNLIFPLFVGQSSEGHWLTAYMGFFLTAAVMPFLGVIAMTVYQGDYQKFFSVLGKTGGFLMSLILLTVWIPLGSGPRCIALAHASLDAHTSFMPPLWLFSILYSIGIAIIVFKKNRMLEILGKFLTPLLLLCLGLIVFKGLRTVSVTPSEVETPIATTMLFGLKEGYNTMDLIASFFFSASIIDILRRSTHDEKGSIMRDFKSGMIGISILGVVYFFMVWVGAAYSAELVGVRKDQLLVHVANLVLGGPLGFVAAIAVMLACMTTSVALLNVYADFLADVIFKDRSKEWIGIVITQLASFVMSLTGLAGITFITQPVFQVCYPLLFILIIFNVGTKLYKNMKCSTAIEQQG